MRNGCRINAPKSHLPYKILISRGTHLQNLIGQLLRIARHRIRQLLPGRNSPHNKNPSHAALGKLTATNPRATLSGEVTRKDGRTDGGARFGTDGQMDGWTDGGARFARLGRTDGRTKEGRNEETKERRNEGTKEIPSNSFKFL